MKHYFELVEIVEPVFLTRTAEQWEQRLTQYDVPFAPVLTIGGFAQHPQTQWLQLIEPERNGVSLLRPAWRFGGERPDRHTEAPRVGQDTRAVAAEVLEPDRLEKLLASGVLFQDS